MRCVSAATGMSRSRLYEIRREGGGKRWTERQALSAAVRQTHRESRGIYGYRRVQQELRRHGIRISPPHARKLMAEQGLRGKKGPKWKKPNLQLSSTVPQDLIQRKFAVAKPRTVIYRDIKYIATKRGMVYADFLEDACTRQILAWDVSMRRTKEFTLRTSKELFESIPETIAIHHTDRGGEYVNDDLQQMLSDHAIRQSCAKGGGISNGMVESFNGTVEVELLRGSSFADIRAVRRALVGYIPWYNGVRLHSNLGYRTPDEAAASYDLPVGGGHY